jgi:hypothetical protein
MDGPLPISNKDCWVKVVAMLQQNWALLVHDPKTGVRIYFVNDTSGVVDEIAFASTNDAYDALGRNGFRRLSDDPNLQSFLRQPSPPFHRASHPNGPIYSSGRLWR